MSAPAGRSALIIGATGATGRHVLRELLASPTYAHVAEYGRRVTPLDKLEVPEDQKAKLTQKTVDFENLGSWGESKFDTVYITLGTTRAAAGGAAQFEKIDRGYVLNAAKAARAEGVDQTLVYLSSAGASASSPFLYRRSKGLTENGLAGLGYKDTIVFRPALLAEAQRENSRLVEGLAERVTGLLQKVAPVFQITVPTLGKAMVRAGELGAAALPAEAEAYKAGPPDAPFTAIGNKGALNLAGK
ncbi:hypothetical protein AURDEDRAFT_113251 [Auricularia subglabra TFB-10046 SS5]|nr:hypothetical protein AURDEDRAFT_113251 [Auricularia subglabra TFB-10046 SS5]